MDIALDYYRIFEAVARHRSFTRAAEALVNSQPNLTRAVHNLEAELGCRLFLRSSRGVELTPEGEALYAHVTAAMEQLAALGLDIPVCGLAKSDEEVFVPWDETPVVLPSGSASLYLIKQVRDESHRFAITFHRELRDRAMTVSVLDDVPGVGPKRKRQIMRHFGSLKRLKAASEEEIAAVPGVPAEVARSVWQTLRAWDAEAAGVAEKAAKPEQPFAPRPQ